MPYSHCRACNAELDESTLEEDMMGGKECHSCTCLNVMHDDTYWILDLHRRLEAVEELLQHPVSGERAPPPPEPDKSVPAPKVDRGPGL